MRLNSKVVLRVKGKILWNYRDFWNRNSIPDKLGLSRHCGFGEWGLLWSSPKKSNFWQTSWSRIMRKLGLKIQFQASITRRHFTQGSSSWLFLPMPQELVALLKVVYICSGKFQLTDGSSELWKIEKKNRPLAKLKKCTKMTTSFTQSWDQSPPVTQPMMQRWVLDWWILVSKFHVNSKKVSKKFLNHHYPGTYCFCNLHKFYI